MKIACVSPDDLSTLIFCRTLSRMLAETDSQRLHTISAVDRYRQELSEIPTVHVEIPMERFVSPIRDLGYLKGLYRIFKRGHYEAVITFTTKPNIYGPVAARLAGVPRIVMAVRGLGRTFNEPESLKERLTHVVVRTLYRLACACSSAVWFTNPNDLDCFVNLGLVRREKCFLTTNAVDLSDFNADNIPRQRLLALRRELELPDDALVVVMVARLIWPKGIREYCEAARQLRDSLPKLHFLLVAPEEAGSPNAVSLDYIREVEACSNLRWLGFRKDVRDLYALSDIATLPSYYKEGGYPRALLEPMAFGKPVIAADTEDCKAPVAHGENGFVVPPRDADALANAIRILATDPEMRRQFGSRSLSRVREHFDDRQVFSSLIERLAALS